MYARLLCGNREIFVLPSVYRFRAIGGERANRMSVNGRPADFRAPAIPSGIGGSSGLHEKLADEIDQLFGTIGLRHVAIAAGRSRPFLIASHGERADRDYGRARHSRQSLDPARTLIAVEHRKLNVHQHEIGMIGFGFGDALGAGRGLDDLVAGALQRKTRDLPQVLLVLDDEYAMGHAAAPETCVRTGSSMRKVDPWPTTDSTEMRPPCISIISLAIASPSPVPPLVLVIMFSTWWNLSKMHSRSSSGMPGPVSLTLTKKLPFFASAEMHTSPASVNFIALPTKLSRTWVRRGSSPRP